MRLRKILLFVINYLFLSNISAQNNEVLFENSPLHEVFKTLERNSNYIFNYDPSLLEGYAYTGTIKHPFIVERVEEILHHSPFSSKVDRQDILIYLPEALSYRLCGTIQDALSHEALIGANIIGTHNSIGDQSDEKGNFDITITAYKNENISISYLGYEPILINIQEMASDTCKNYMLKVDKNLWGDEIVITDYLLNGITAGTAYSGYEMDYNVLSQHHTNVEHDILKTTQFLPGVMSLDDSASNLQIRGSTPDQNLILWEGAPLYSAGHVFGMISAINPFSVDAVNIYKGSYDPKYDNRVGGIIDISLSNSINNDLHGSVGSTLTEGHLNLDIPILKDKLSVALSGRHSINGVYNSPPLISYTNKVFQHTLIGDQFEEVSLGFIEVNQRLQYADWNTKLLYEPSDHISIRASLYSNDQSFGYQFSYPNDPFISTSEITVNSIALNTQLSWKPNNKWINCISYLQSSYHNLFDQFDVEKEIIEVDFYQLNDIQDQIFSLSTEYLSAPGLSFSGGYSFNLKQVDFDIIDDSIYKPFFEERILEAASFHNLYTSSSYSKKSFSADVGIRTTYYHEQARWVASPRFTFQLAISDALKLKTEGGIFHQFINQLSENDRSIRVDNPIWIINAEESQLSQRATKLSAGLIYDNRGWLLDIEAYVNQTKGLSTLSPTINTPRSSVFSRGTADASGLNVLLKKRWSRFHTWINYSYGKILFDFPEINSEAFFAPNDVPHALSIAASYEVKGLQLSLHTNYRSGIPFSEPIGVFDYVDDVDNMKYFSVDYVDINDARIKDYLRTDFNLHYHPTLKQLGKARAELSFSIINVFNRENIYAREYFLEYDELDAPTLAHIQKSLLVRTPLVMCRLYW